MPNYRYNPCAPCCTLPVCSDCASNWVAQFVGLTDGAVANACTVNPCAAFNGTFEMNYVPQFSSGGACQWVAALPATLFGVNSNWLRLFIEIFPGAPPYTVLVTLAIDLADVFNTGNLGAFGCSWTGTFKQSNLPADCQGPYTLTLKPPLVCTGGPAAGLHVPCENLPPTVTVNSV